MTAVRDLTQIIKAYDVRGVYPDQLDAELAERVGAAFAQVVGAASRSPAGPAPSSSAATCARRVRSSWPPSAPGVTGQGVDVVDIGLASTDELYFAAGRLGLPGAMFTASHNPAQYNGIKLCRAGATPVGQDIGPGPDPRPGGRAGPAVRTTPRAPSPSRDLLAEYAGFLHELVDLSAIRR